jgi:hypothetical protein
MSTHDYVIANASGSSVRSDLNNALAAIVSNNSSSSEPSTKYAYMLWVDTTNNLIKLRNSANNAWIILFTTAGGLDVDAASNFNEDVTFTGASANVTWDKSADDFIFNDNAKAVFGTSSDGLALYHDGSNSYINESGTGGLKILTGGLQVKNAADDSYMAFFGSTGATEIYFNGSKKLETNSSGITITGNSYVTGNDDHPDNSQARFGTSNDLAIYHNGTHSFINNSTGHLILTSTATDNVDIMKAGHSEYMARFKPDNAVELYYDNSKKLETKSYGIQIAGGVHINSDSEKLYLGADSDLQIFFDGTNGYVYAGNDGRAGPVIKVENQGNNNDRDGILIQCGKDDSSGTNVALEVKDGNGTTQGHLLFTNGTLSLDPFTAAHPCIVPDADNPSDDSMAYPYGTLLETTDIEYKKNPDGSSTERGIIYKVQKTQTANSKKVLGAYSGSMNNRPDNGPNMHHVYVLGDGHILVNNAGGNIEVGDGICSSATAGLGQKATANPSMIIGIAQEAVTFTGTETKLVAVQYGLQQFIPWS